jgi:hypothetical protein
MKLTLTCTRILPMLALLFLCSFLDRTNVGNAKTYGLEASLKMTDHQYETGLAVYYLTYIIRYLDHHPKRQKTLLWGDAHTFVTVKSPVTSYSK